MLNSRENETRNVLKKFKTKVKKNQLKWSYHDCANDETIFELKSDYKGYDQFLLQKDKYDKLKEDCRVAYYAVHSDNKLYIYNVDALKPTWQNKQFPKSFNDETLVDKEITFLSRDDADIVITDEQMVEFAKENNQYKNRPQHLKNSKAMEVFNEIRQQLELYATIKKDITVAIAKGEPRPKSYTEGRYQNLIKKTIRRREYLKEIVF